MNPGDIFTVRPWTRRMPRTAAIDLAMDRWFVRRAHKVFRRIETMPSNGDYPNSGSLFRNTEKQNDRQPDYGGSADIVCASCGERMLWRVSAWVKASREGKKFFSLSFRTKADMPAGGRDHRI
jgi:hypothetical protein